MANERATRRPQPSSPPNPPRFGSPAKGCPSSPGRSPAYHWDANDLALADGANVTSWVDQASGRNMTPSGGNAPSFHLGASPLGNMPGVRFDGNERLGESSTHSLSHMTGVHGDA